MRKLDLARKAIILMMYFEPHEGESVEDFVRRTEPELRKMLQSRARGEMVNA